MGREVEEVEIDGTRYSVSQYSAGKAVRLLAKLVKLVGRPIGILTGAGMDSEIKTDLIASALEALGSSVEPEDLEKLVREILEGTIIFTEDGKNRQIVFDTDFTGRIGHLFRVLKHVLSYQYADFLGDLAAVKI